jgi:predicted amidophosphoribosyltransferase
MSDGLITFDKPLKIGCYHCRKFIDIEKTVYMDNHLFCPDCYEKVKKEKAKPDFTNHDGSFDYDFVPDESRESSKPVTDVDIHKIIDDAMEKKDRSVTIFITKDTTSVSVYPYEDKPREWVLRTGNAVYPWVCPECGDTFKESSRHCPSCGEELRRPINY